MISLFGLLFLLHSYRHQDLPEEIDRLHSSVIFVQFFFLSGFSYNHSQVTGLQGKGEHIPLTPHYHFHLLHIYSLGHQPVDYCRELTSEHKSLTTKIGTLLIIWMFFAPLKLFGGFGSFDTRFLANEDPHEKINRYYLTNV